MTTITKTQEVEVATLPATLTATMASALDALGYLIVRTGEVRGAVELTRKSIADTLSDIRRESASAEQAAGIVAARCAAAAQAWRTDPATAKIGEGQPDDARRKLIAEAYASAVYYGVEAIKQAMHAHPDYIGKDGKPLSFAFNKPKHAAVVAGTATVQAHVTVSDRKSKGTGSAGRAESASEPEAQMVKPSSVDEWANQGIAAFELFPCVARMLLAAGLNADSSIRLCKILDAAKATGKALTLAELLKAAERNAKEATKGIKAA
jgi:hypothetical protein